MSFEPMGFTQSPGVVWPSAPPGAPGLRDLPASRATRRRTAARVGGGGVADAADRPLEAIGQRAARLLWHRSNTRPACLRLPHVLVRGPGPARPPHPPPAPRRGPAPPT